MHVFFSSSLDGGELSSSLPGRFMPGVTVAGTHWVGDWMSPRTGLEALDKDLLSLSGIQPLLFTCPACNPLLYRVRDKVNIMRSLIKSSVF
jgi:hypothetical protein